MLHFNKGVVTALLEHLEKISADTKALSRLTKRSYREPV
jgi:hypothetical protein